MTTQCTYRLHYIFVGIPNKTQEKVVTHNVCAEVGWNLRFDPILAAAMIWTAHPQSMEAMPPIEPIVFASTISKTKR